VVFVIPPPAIKRGLVGTAEAPYRLAKSVENCPEVD